MKKARLSILIILLLVFSSLALPAHAQTGIRLVSDTVSLTFPESATFHAEFTSAAKIDSVALEYGVDQLTCGTVEAKAFPPITASTDVVVEWTWEMRQSGSLPPGASLWWRWQVRDASGATFTSPKQTIIWLDNTHDWQVISGGNINLHYYSGGTDFGQALHDAAAQALARLSKDIGLTAEKPVDLYIYANTDDLKASILYEPSWVGGQAYPENNIVIIGITPDQLDWGKSTEAHELTHVLVGHLTFTCLGFVPTWLNEGLAMYGEGGPQAAEQAQFDQARANNQLLSLRSLTGNFSEEADRATLSYTESYSVVDFLVKTYGQEKMMVLLRALRDGETPDDALKAGYGFDTDGLEDAWRQSIGATPRTGSANPTPLPTPTIVPTFVPVGAAPVAQAAVSTPHPSPVPPTAPPEPARDATRTASPTAASSPLGIIPGLSQNILTILEFGLICVVIVVLVVGVPILVATRRQRRKK